MTILSIARTYAPLPAVRQRYAVELLRTLGVVSCHDLKMRFGISEATARRDIHAVVRRGYGVRVYGGAVLPGGRISARTQIASRAASAAWRRG